jgi:Ca-activated chloride channel family protein
MLNLYVAFRMASERATAGDDAAALSILGAVRGGVAGWLAGREDFDIEDDLRYVDMFLANLQARAPVTPPEPDLPPEPWPAD